MADDVTHRLKALSHAWVDCKAMTDDELANQIVEDAIDILVDLSGHTNGNRLKVFARKPAPLQVSWFGFPTSTGLQAIQYRFTDHVIDPPGLNDAFNSEKLIRLPGFYAVYKPDRIAPPVEQSPVLRKGYLTLASFNNLAKITPEVLRTWADILNTVPNSKLLMQAAGLDGAAISEKIRDSFLGQNIAADRLILRGWSDLSQFFNTCNEVDIALDTFPFNGGVTTSHCMWMGLPVITMKGKSAASRVGASMIQRIGLSEELVAATFDEYISKATELANRQGDLIGLRSTMRQRMVSGGLLDGQSLSSSVHSAFREMWQTWCAADRASA